ncbi:MAG: Na+/H+ antiporter subunit D [Methanocalculus sp. MSAO_Arc1]|uniref:proton-conducting transporter transmembrane domain-containing protein n=1 Tax=Methanocalculus TaxID=71151 RepID=UPI000FF8602C|nr:MULTISPECIES: proton-conducting transporter membrane subunit [unclassified Methanocalculus]MCP1662673.1 multicomponent Na+:H+ antiporter subunit D [Methanocalculus sp. AMF5]RQD80296.1 MAG: Na+/H+ antiporter subunit D [Methanocalculus sp. MSAO_Arc1]
MMLFPPFLVYLLGALLLPVIPKRLRHEFLLLVAIIGLAGITLLEPGHSGWHLQLLPGISLTLLAVEGLSILVGYAFAGVGVLLVIYAHGEDRLWHQAATLLQIGSGVGIVFAGDFISLFLFWELLALSSLILIWYGGAYAEGAGYRYAMLHILGGAVLLGAIAMQFAETGSLAITAAGPGLVSLLFLIGIGLNAGIIPFHVWIPDSYPRASIVGSVVLCIFTTKAAVYLLARVLPGSEVVMYLGAIMVVYGIVFALLQDDMRSLLSYHIISQVGYMVTAIGIGTTLAINGGMAHLFNNIIYKTLLFMVVGAIILQTGRYRLKELGGLRRQMPLTFAASLLASAAIAGVPGFSGYVSKELIVAAAAESGFFTLETLLLIGSVGTFLSFIKLNYYAFIKEKQGIVASDPPLPMKIPMAALGAACLVYGVYPGVLFGILPYPVFHNVFGMAHILEMIIIFAAVILNLWVARNIIRPITYSPPDMMALYVKAGHGILRISRFTLPAVAGAMSGIITTIGRKSCWLVKNPLMGAVIMLRRNLLRAQAAVGMGRRSDPQLEKLIAQYPGNGAPVHETGMSLVVMAAILFVYYLVVFII